MVAPPPCASTRRHVVVLAGGDPVRPPLPRPLPRADAVIAADSGLAAAEGLGLSVDVVVGDLDSVEPAQLAAARAAGVRIEVHPRDKDRTDLAIALDTAIDSGAEAITVVGGAGGRFDHLLAGALLLASPSYADAEVTAVMGPAVVTVVRGERRLHGRSGEIVGLVAVHGPARGVTTQGLAYPLIDDELSAGSSRGVSNILHTDTALVHVREGVLLAVQPGAMAPDGVT